MTSLIIKVLEKITEVGLDFLGRKIRAEDVYTLLKLVLVDDTSDSHGHGGALGPVVREPKPL